MTESQNKTRSSDFPDRTADDSCTLDVSSTHPEKSDSWVSTSFPSQEHRGHDTRRLPAEESAVRIMSAVKPLRESSPSEAVIDIKPEADDDLMGEDLNFAQELPSGLKNPLVAVTYNSPQATALVTVPEKQLLENKQHLSRTSESSANLYRQTPVTRHPDMQLYRPPEALRLCTSESFSGISESYRPAPKPSSDRGAREEDSFRKRKMPVISSVVRVKSINDDEEEDEEDDDYASYVSRTGSLPSSVLVPAKPERRPSLPISKQANKNLILKAISEAQESVTKTTCYPAVPQKQMVPVAPRTRSMDEGLIQEVVPVQTSTALGTRLQGVLTEQKSLPETQAQHSNVVSRLQIDPSAVALQRNYDSHAAETLLPSDTRSFILKTPAAEETTSVPKPELRELLQKSHPQPKARIIQSRDTHRGERPPSPKFIVTLDGVPSPPGYTSDVEDEEMGITEEEEKLSKSSLALHKVGKKRVLESQHHIIFSQIADPDVIMEDVSDEAKRQKLSERCRYWPACKNGDSCIYHHPTTPCKTFPKCKFADKCLFIHPNCKYDAKCTRPDCPYTHASRRVPPPQPAVPVPVPIPDTAVCKFFPDCKNMNCSFYHPKHCRFSTQCKRPDCLFYHPTTTLPPRHALKWSRKQTSQ
ncbi:zinc finger CCCH domain-containing protein 14 isoform X2 [Protopterus annectens]|nr:zinc finger CCCH domain-containing protein 14 isoform X2 [Protopterus annectens]